MLTSSGRNIDFMIKTVAIAIWLLLLLTVGFTFHLSSTTHFATKQIRNFSVLLMKVMLNFILETVSCQFLSKTRQILPNNKCYELEFPNGFNGGGVISKNTSFL